MRWAVILLALAACGAEPNQVSALTERVDHLQRRLDAVEAKLAATPVPKDPPVVAVATPEISPPVAPSPVKHPVVRIGVHRSGITIDGVPIAADDLAASLRAAVTRPGVTSAILETSGDAEHAQLVDLIGQIKRAGLTNVAITTRDDATAR